MAWSPYGKGQGTSPSVMGVFATVGLDNELVSGLEKFEGPDPAYWCARGYAILNPDIRGVVDSDGDSVLWDRQDGRDCYDLVEWLAEQERCSGKVGMSGTSYLAASQWFTAAAQPPNLAAINPWEGVSDVYRDLVMRGGMPDTGFAAVLQHGSAHSFDRVQKLAPGEVVNVEIDLLPLGLVFYPGEQLRFVISSREPSGTDDAGGPRVRPRQQRTPHHPHRRRARVLPSTPRSDAAIAHLTALTCGFGSIPQHR